MNPANTFRFPLFALILSACFAACAQTNSPDRIAEIAAAPATQNDALVTPEPPTLPQKFLPHSAHDPHAVFQPAEKMDSPQKLSALLDAERKWIAHFLEDSSPAQASTRTIQKLETFAWRAATAADWQNFAATLAGEGEWQTVHIPHYGEPIGRTNTFYRTTFTLAPWQANEAVFVRFRGVDYKAHVFVNGALAGSHEGFFAPFEFDVTRSVHPGENVLFVQVDNDFPTLGVVNDPKYLDLMGDKLYAATGPGFDDPSAGWHHDPPGMGIYQPVTIEVRPRVHVHDIFVRPLPESKSAEALIEVWNCDTELRDVEIRFAVHGLNFEQVAVPERAIEKPDPSGGGVNFYRVRFPLSNVRTWSLEEPWLYDFQVSVRSSKVGTTDNARRHFGMRSFRLDETTNPKGKFYLNNAEIRLRGANTMGFEQQDVMRGDSNQLRDDFLLAKIAHLNFLRITQRPVQDEVYDMADRLGLMVQTDFPLFSHMRPNQFGEGVRQAAEMERLIRSHPSCVLVTYINERFSDQKSRGKISRRMGREEMERFFIAADQAVLSQNPDRAIKAVEGDYDSPAPGLPDNHCYTLWYFRNGIDIGLLHKGYWQAIKPGWNYSCGEFGAEGLDRVELMRARCPSNWLPATAEQEKTWTPARIVRAQTAEMYPNFFDQPHSLDGWVNASREHQAFATRMMTEAFRRDDRMVSFAIHLFIDAWPTGWMKAILDVERQPKPAFFAYREALTPLMANIRTDRWKFFSGEKMKCEFWICNDTLQVPAKPMIAWELELDGKIIHAQRAPAEVRPGQAAFQGFTDIPVPDVAQRTAGKLRLALFDGTQLVHDTAIDVEFFPKTKPIAVPVQIIGAPKGQAARLASELGLRTTATAPVYLIDDYAAYEKRRGEIDEAIRGGARAIFLNLPVGGYVLPGSTARVTVQSANPHFLSRAPGHQLVAGFEEFDFRFWYDKPADMITPLANGKFSGSDWTTILKAQGLNAVAERSAGQGKVVLCEAFLDGRVTANPTAREFAERLLVGK
jgi:Glycosyl hydrolase 2 galactose-binding domain-like/Glycosyl hydrolases family 2/Glycosyl hydrolases family 2, TIM barrel domain